MNYTFDYKSHDAFEVFMSGYLTRDFTLGKHIITITGFKVIFQIRKTIGVVQTKADVVKV